MAVEPKKVEGNTGRTFLEEGINSTEQRRVRLGTADSEAGDTVRASAPGGRFGAPLWEQQRASEEISQRSIRVLNFT